jgi:hypothetical protein
MQDAGELKIALKEWAVVCSALGAGRQIILLRKGGIYESSGEFEIEHRRFVFFPTYLHQNAAMLKESEGAGLTPVAAEPEKIEISLAGEITDILPVTDRAAMDALDELHIWSPKLIDMRFNYRPENPSYLLLVRAYRLPTPTIISNTPAYAGCKSWVPLEGGIDAEDARPVLREADYLDRTSLIMKLRGAISPNS